ncbi:MAG TPA: hypothetical protein VKM55_20250 [Candidatus Lokiarchaeia archaeon]|nr:hypothetical protein [Candidatus Lokiarchaeia archaeon]
MSISFEDFQSILNKLKDALIQKPFTKLFIEDIARAAEIDVKTAEMVYDVLLDIDATLFDVEIDREIRGKFIRYEPEEEEESDEDDDFEDDESLEGEEEDVP